MKKIKLFEEYLNERYVEDQIPQLQITLRGTIGLTSKTEDFTKKLMETLYDKYIHMVLIVGTDQYNREERIPNNRRFNKIKYDVPLLNFTSSNHNFVSDMRAKVYNKVEDLQLSADKKLFYLTFPDTNFIPKTVYSLDDIETLDLPIIAKPSTGYSAQGIEKFDTYDDAKESKSKFDVWQEGKDIDREFRAFIMDGKVIHIAERITNSNNDMSVGKKGIDEKIDLVYFDQNLETFKYIDRINEIMKELNKSVKLEFYNIDLILDKSGDLWVPEINGAPGIGPSMVLSIYKSFQKMALNIDIPVECETELQEIADKHRKLMAKEYPKEYKSSLDPIKVK
jgi:glutathione synthase/RimK-type ligase-like ATP-grasp enzyme